MNKKSLKQQVITITILLTLMLPFLATGCEGGGVAQQIYPAPTMEFEERFNRWAEQMDAGTLYATTGRINTWLQDKSNMSYAPGRRAEDWPGYQCWGQAVNCNGFSQVALECLHRRGYKGFKLLVVWSPELLGGWHAVCTNGNIWISNNGRGFMNPKTFKNPDGSTDIDWKSVAPQIVGTWTDYKVFTRELSLVDSGARYGAPVIDTNTIAKR